MLSLSLVKLPATGGQIMSSTENPMLTRRIKVTVNIGVGEEATDSFWLKGPGITDQTKAQ